MPRPTRPDQHIDNLRRWRTRPEPDLSLRFLKDQFQHQIARPYKQVSQLAELWQQLVPPPLLPHTRLDSFSRGVLRVAVASSVHLYELDHLLRSGLEQQLIRLHSRGTLRRVQLFLDQGAFT